jgi:hypothetical protein
LSDEAIKELSFMLTEVKLSTERMAAKLEQTCDSIERLERSIHRIDNAVSSQERRVIILEQKLPDNLLQDLALIKDSQEVQKKIMWGVISAILATWAKSILALLP